MNEQFLWVEKYRPSKIEECILPPGLRSIFQGVIERKEIPNLLLSGPPGVGKTTVAKAMCAELDSDFLLINGSQDSGIDVLRTTIRSFSSSVSFTSSSRKVVILDEADYLNPQSTQPALRGFIEEFSANAAFVFTANHKNRIIPAIHSRCSVVEFTLKPEDKMAMVTGMLARMEAILAAENVEYDKKAVATLVLRYYPDFRRTINEVQTYANRNGRIDADATLSSSTSDVAVLFRAMADKKYAEIRSWVHYHLDNDPIGLFRAIFEAAPNHIEPKSIPQLVLHISEYADKRLPFSANPEITLLAWATECMVDLSFIK